MKQQWKTPVVQELSIVNTESRLGRTGNDFWNTGALSVITDLLGMNMGSPKGQKVKPFDWMK